MHAGHGVRRDSAYVRWRRGPRLVPKATLKLSNNPPWSFASPCKGGRSGVPEVAGREYRLSGSLRFLLGFASLKGGVRSALRSGVWADPGQWAEGEEAGRIATLLGHGPIRSGGDGLFSS